MIPANLWEYQNAIKALYSKCVEAVCEKYDMTRMELDILLFLANNPAFDTASDMIELRHLSKSQVSVSVKILEQKGCLRKWYAEGNRKTAHLAICENASEILSDGREAQERFAAILFQGLKEEELAVMKRCNARIFENIHCYLKEE